MALTELTANLNTHQSLPDQPALTAEELKQLWDEAPNEIKNYINQVLTKELDSILANKVDKIVGKVLSSNDFTDALKTKLNGIEASANNYVHPTTSGNKHVPSGGSSNQILRWSSDGTASWSNEIVTTVLDVLTSDSATAALSAKQGKNLQTQINAKQKTISRGTAAPSGGSNGDIYIQYFN